MIHPELLAKLGIKNAHGNKSLTNVGIEVFIEFEDGRTYSGLYSDPKTALSEITEQHDQEVFRARPKHASFFHNRQEA